MTSHLASRFHSIRNSLGQLLLRFFCVHMIVNCATQTEDVYTAPAAIATPATAMAFTDLSKIIPATIGSAATLKTAGAVAS